MLGEAELELRCSPPEFTQMQGSGAAAAHSWEQDPTPVLSPFPTTFTGPSVGLSLPLLGGALLQTDKGHRRALMATAHRNTKSQPR